MPLSEHGSSRLKTRSVDNDLVVVSFYYYLMQPNLMLNLRISFCLVRVAQCYLLFKNH